MHTPASLAANLSCTEKVALHIKIVFAARGTPKMCNEYFLCEEKSFS
jgi:hypothetical protein